jgi:flagellar basal body-associated protein FliL
MLKLLLTGIWVCAITLGAVYASVQMSLPSAPVDETAAKNASLTLVKGEPITIPVIGDGAINGYFLGRISLRMNKEKMAGLHLPVTELMTDELFTLLAGTSMINLAKVSTFDVEEFKKRIREGLNKKLNDEIVEDVLIEQLDYLSKDDIRSNKASNGAPASVKIVGEGPIQETAAPSH